MCLGIPGRITAVFERDGLRLGNVDFGGVTREVCIDSVPEAGVDAWVIVHVGYAISVLDEEEAAETLATLREMFDLEEELGGGS